MSVVAVDEGRLRQDGWSDASLDETTQRLDPNIQPLEEEASADALRMEQTDFDSDTRGRKEEREV